MNFLEQLQRLERMHQLIRLKATGKPKDFADKLSVSESTLYDLLNIAREMGACIEFSRTSQSYVYHKPMDLHLGFSQKESLQIKGGVIENFQCWKDWSWIIYG